MPLGPARLAVTRMSLSRGAPWQVKLMTLQGAVSLSHVRLADRTAHIPDTETGVPRTIPLTDAALDVLATRGDAQSKGRVFPLSMEALKQGWEHVRNRAGLGDLHFHDLRHEAISRLCEMGLSLPEVALMSGHKDMRMLFRYVNLRPSDLARKLTGRTWAGGCA